jgi:hypothetical protein
MRTIIANAKSPRGRDGFLVRCECGREQVVEPYGHRRNPRCSFCAGRLRGQIVLTVDGKRYRVRDLAELVGLTVTRARAMLSDRERAIERVRRALSCTP